MEQDSAKEGRREDSEGGGSRKPPKASDMNVFPEWIGHESPLSAGGNEAH